MPTDKNIGGGVFYCYNESTSKIPFYQCAFQLFSDNNLNDRNFVDDIVPSFDKNGTLLLQRIENQGLKLFHPPSCPLLKHPHLKDKDMSRKDNNIQIGSAVLLKSSDGYILLSRRAKTLRTFPGLWVPPGGHAEEGETLEEAGIRELEEEVGVVFSSANDFSIESLCLFESCYPPRIEWGQPKRHHIVNYFVLYSKLKKDELNLCIQLCEREVDAIIWLPEFAIKALLDKDVSSIPKVEMMTSENGVLQTNIFLDPAVFTNQVSGDSGIDVERFSTGTLIALRSLVENSKSTQ